MRLLPLVLLLLVGCGSTEIPPLPETFDTVVVTSSLPADELYADGVAAFLRSNWEPLTPTEEGLVVSVLPDGMRDDSTALLVTLRVVPAGAGAGAAAPERAGPDLADPDYGVPDLARGDVVEDASREPVEPESLRAAAADRPAITEGDAVLTATVDASRPGARRVLVRTAKILAAVRGDLSYR